MTAINEEYVRSRERQRRFVQTFSLLLVLSAFVLPFLDPRFIYLLWPMTLGVFVLSSVSKRLAWEWGFGPRTHALLSRALAPLNNRYWLGHYVPVDGAVVNHLLVGPEGVLVLEARRHRHQTSCSGDRWQRRTTFLGRLFGPEPPLGNPGRDLAAAVELTQRDLSEAALDGVPVSGAVVFVSPDTVLSLDSCNVTALTASQLESWAASRKVPVSQIDESTRRRVTEHFGSRLPSPPRQRKARAA